jgi:hypothetical protein
MKSTVTFKQFFESMTVGAALGGAPGGYSPDNISSSDFYAPGDARIPKGGVVISRKGLVKTSKKRKKIKSVENNYGFRSLANQLSM